MADPYSHLRLSDDGAFLISGNESPKLHGIKQKQQVSLAGNPRGMEFVSADLLVGYDADREWGFWSATTGRRLTHAKEKLGNVPIAASAALDLAIEPGRPQLVLRNFAGTQLANILVDQRGEVALSERGVLSVVEPARVVFIQLPSRERLGVLLNHPETGEVAFMAGSGELETSGDPLAWRELLRCQVGMQELPLEVCLDAWQEPGIAGKKLLGAAPD